MRRSRRGFFDDGTVATMGFGDFDRVRRNPTGRGSRPSVPVIVVPPRRRPLPFLNQLRQRATDLDELDGLGLERKYLMMKPWKIGESSSHRNFRSIRKEQHPTVQFYKRD